MREVKDTQASGLMGDQTRWQRGGPWEKLFTNFISFFAATYQLNVEIYKRDKLNLEDYIMASWDAVLINFIPSVMMMMMRQVIDRECDFNDATCLARKLGSEQTEFIMGMHPITRELGRNIAPLIFSEKPWTYKGPAGLAIADDFNQLVAGFAKDEWKAPLLYKANEVGGVLFRYPAGQINDTLKGIMAIADGDVEGIEAIPALISGPPPNKR